jgi:hypothetical protein
VIGSLKKTNPPGLRTAGSGLLSLFLATDFFGKARE